MDPMTAALAEQAGTIASRFESQSSIDEAKERKDAEWQAAYARLGQAPPKREEEQVQDGRTLFERLQSNKELKKEEWDNKMKLGNQYRGLDSEEMAFLAEKARERAEADRKKEQIENAEIMEYRERLAAKNAALMSVEPPKTGSSSSSTAKKVPAKPVKNVKSLMKGIVVKKKPKPVPGSAKPADGTESATVASIEKGAASSAASSKRPADDSPAGDETKKQKTTSDSPS